MSDTSEPLKLRPLEWVGSARSVLVAFPISVRKEIGHSLHLAQVGERALNAKALRGFGGAGVLEIVATYDGNAYRAVYTVKFTRAVYVLHVFQKKSKHGVATPKSDLDLIKQRLSTAVEHYQKHYSSSRT